MTRPEMMRRTVLGGDMGAAMRSIVKVETVVIRGKRVDCLTLECGHEVISKFVGDRKFGTRTRCRQCRK